MGRMIGKRPGESAQEVMGLGHKMRWALGWVSPNEKEMITHQITSILPCQMDDVRTLLYSDSGFSGCRGKYYSRVADT